VINYKDSKHFCIIPFVSMMVDTSASLRYCCIATGPEADLHHLKDTDTLQNYSTTPIPQKMHAGKDSVQEAWNSHHMQCVRRDMLADKPVKACENCYKTEATGGKSYRYLQSKEWYMRLGKDKFEELIKSAEENNGYLDDDIVYLDLRLGNLCNLKCRMCNPFNSSQIAKEHFKLYDENEEYKKIYSDTMGDNPIHLKEGSGWADSNMLWSDVIRLIPNLKKVYMTGGEPTLIENNYRFMEECLAQGRNDINLFFNINCTNVTQKFLDLISQFEDVKINASLDGYGEMNDYIRFPSKWSAVSKNAKAICAIPSVTFNLTPVVQIYNLNNIHKLLWFVDELTEEFGRPVGLDYLICYFPDYLDPRALPMELRQPAIDRLKEYQSTGKCIEHGLISNSIDKALGHLEAEQYPHHEKLLDQFRSYTKVLDRTRNQDFSKIDTELYNAIFNG